MRWCVLAVMLTGCRGQDEATRLDLGACTGSIPLACSTACELPVCPATPPSTEAAVAIIKQHCTVCHAKDSSEPQRPYETYSQIHREAGPILRSVFTCIMPKPGDTFDQLTPDERVLLESWLVCGVPDAGPPDPDFGVSDGGMKP